MRNFVSLTALALLLLGSAAHVVAAVTPEQAVREYFKTLNGKKPDDIATLIHPQEKTKLRTIVEPTIVRALRGSDGRSLFPQFVDPYNLKKMREMDDGEFCAAFVRWMMDRQPLLPPALKEAEIVPVGHVRDGDTTYVVTRTRIKFGKFESEQIGVIALLDLEGDPMLALPPEVLRTAEGLRQNPLR